MDLLIASWPCQNHSRVGEGQGLMRPGGGGRGKLEYLGFYNVTYCLVDGGVFHGLRLGVRSCSMRPMLCKMKSGVLCITCVES